MRERLARLTGRTRGERLLAAGTVLAIVVAILAFILLDTEGDGERDPYTAAADGQCVAAKRQIADATAAALEPGSGGGVEAYARAVLGVVTEWELAFAGLRPRADEREGADRLRDALRVMITETGALAQAASSGQQARIEAQAARVDEATVELEESIADLGLDRCAALAFATPGRGGN